MTITAYIAPLAATALLALFLLPGAVTQTATVTTCKGRSLGGMVVDQQVSAPSLNHGGTTMGAPRRTTTTRTPDPDVATVEVVLFAREGAVKKHVVRYDASPADVTGNLGNVYLGKGALSALGLTGAEGESITISITRLDS